MVEFGLTTYLVFAKPFNEAVDKVFCKIFVRLPCKNVSLFIFVAAWSSWNCFDCPHRNIQMGWFGFRRWFTDKWCVWKVVSMFICLCTHTQTTFVHIKSYNDAYNGFHICFFIVKNYSWYLAWHTCFSAVRDGHIMFYLPSEWEHMKLLTQSLSADCERLITEICF